MQAFNITIFSNFNAIENVAEVIDLEGNISYRKIVLVLDGSHNMVVDRYRMAVDPIGETLAKAFITSEQAAINFNPTPALYAAAVAPLSE